MSRMHWPNRYSNASKPPCSTAKRRSMAILLSAQLLGLLPTHSGGLGRGVESFSFSRQAVVRKPNFEGPYLDKKRVQNLLILQSASSEENENVHGEKKASRQQEEKGQNIPSKYESQKRLENSITNLFQMGSTSNNGGNKYYDPDIQMALRDFELNENKKNDEYGIGEAPYLTEDSYLQSQEYMGPDGSLLDTDFINDANTNMMGTASNTKRRKRSNNNDNNANAMKQVISSLIQGNPDIPPEYFTNTSSMFTDEMDNHDDQLLFQSLSQSNANDANKLDPEEIHRQVFSNEEGYLNQSEVFRQFLSPNMSSNSNNNTDNEMNEEMMQLEQQRQEALAERRGADYRRRQREAMELLTREMEDLEEMISSREESMTNTEDDAKAELTRRESHLETMEVKNGSPFLMGRIGGGVGFRNPMELERQSPSEGWDERSYSSSSSSFSSPPKQHQGPQLEYSLDEELRKPKAPPAGNGNAGNSFSSKRLDREAWRAQFNSAQQQQQKQQRQRQQQTKNGRLSTNPPQTSTTPKKMNSFDNSSTASTAGPGKIHNHITKDDCQNRRNAKKITVDTLPPLPTSSKNNITAVNNIDNSNSKSKNQDDMMQVMMEELQRLKGDVDAYRVKAEQAENEASSLRQIVGNMEKKFTTTQMEEHRTVSGRSARNDSREQQQQINQKKAKDMSNDDGASPYDDVPF